MIRSALLAAALAVATASMPVAAVAQPARQLSQKQEQGERRALASFAAGRYDEAVQIYSELYADYRDPVYLRNIGRCYQKLRDPDKAISSFEEYLARAKKITPAEQDEVRGFIRDLQAQKQQHKPVEATPKPAEAAPPPPALPPLPAPSVPAQPGAVQPDVTAQPTPSGGSSTMRVAGWGTIGLAGALAVAGGVTMAGAWSRHSDADNKCLTRAECDAAASSIESRSTTSKLLFAGAVIAGAAGGVLLYLGADRSGSGEVSGVRFGARGTF